jgi:urease accessory protein
MGMAVRQCLASRAESRRAERKVVQEVEALESGVLPCPSRFPAIARSRGAVDLSFKTRGRSTVFGTLYQSGCLRIRMPPPEPSASPEAIIINTSGGLTGGDQVSLSASWQSGASAVLCTQAAEKIYRSTGAEVRITNRLLVGAGASAEWLPQETILFDRARLRRNSEVDVCEGARFLAAEGVIFGRMAMREEIVAGELRDCWHVRIGGKLVYADILHLAGAIAERLDRNAVGGRARALGMILLVTAEDLKALLQRLRNALALARGRAAASSWNGLLAMRFLASDGEVLRHDMVLALNILRGGRPLPRAWQC